LEGGVCGIFNYSFQKLNCSVSENAWKTSIRIASNPSMIRTRSSLNTGLEYYSYVNCCVECFVSSASASYCLKSLRRNQLPW
jgi:hypothetical protein